MPTNIHSLADHIRRLYIERASLDLADAGYLHTVSLKVGTPRTRNEVGIHLSSPTEAELLDALDKAERDGFPAVFVYPSDII